VRGSSDFRDGCWQGYEGTDIECVIDLGEVKDISKITPRFMLDANSWIFLPSKVEASISEDGKTFTNTVVKDNMDDQKSSEIYAKDFPLNFGNAKARYIKFKAVGLKQCPAWHPYAGNKSWLFIDEIVVE
jgi:hexosaminidase